MGPSSLTRCPLFRGQITAGSAVAASWAVGLVLVQLNLSQWGYVGISELRLRYIVPGFLWLAITLPPLSTGIAAASARGSSTQRWRPPQPWASCLAALLSTFALLVTLLNLLQSCGVPIGVSMPGITRYLAYVFLVGVVGGSWVFGRPSVSRLYLAAGASFAVVLLVLAFGPVYTVIPAGWGGGRPMPVRARVHCVAMPPEVCRPEGMWPDGADGSRVCDISGYMLDQTGPSYILLLPLRGDSGVVGPPLEPAVSRHNFLIVEVARGQVLSVTYMPPDRAGGAPRARPARRTPFSLGGTSPSSWIDLASSLLPAPGYGNVQAHSYRADTRWPSPVAAPTLVHARLSARMLSHGATTTYALPKLVLVPAEFSLMLEALTVDGDRVHALRPCWQPVDADLPLLARRSVQQGSPTSLLTREVGLLASVCSTTCCDRAGLEWHLPVYVCSRMWRWVAPAQQMKGSRR